MRLHTRDSHSIDKLAAVLTCLYVTIGTTIPSSLNANRNDASNPEVPVVCRQNQTAVKTERYSRRKEDDVSTVHTRGFRGHLCCRIIGIAYRFCGLSGMVGWPRSLQRRASILTFRFYSQTAMAEHQLVPPMLAIFRPSL